MHSFSSKRRIISPQTSGSNEGWKTKNALVQCKGGWG